MASSASLSPRSVSATSLSSASGSTTRGKARVVARAAATQCSIRHHRRRRPRAVAVAVASSSSDQPPPLPLSVGFDLGTANSSVAVFRDGGPVIVPDTDSGVPSVTTPSWVAVDPKSLKLLVGHRAKKQAPTNPANSFGSAKRLLGRRYRALPRAELSSLGYGVVEAFDGRAAVWCPARGEAMTPVEVCGALLAHLADRARRSGGGSGGGNGSGEASESGGEAAAAAAAAATSSSSSSPASYFIKNAVITVPDRFGEEQLAAVQAAAEAAGLKGVRLVHEPVAAAIAYGLGSPRARADGTSSPSKPLAETTGQGDSKQQQQPPPFDDDTVLVVDLGGGTLDVAVVDAFEGMLEVIGSSGDARLGGDDWDSALAEWLEGQHPVAAGLAAVGGRAGSAAARVRLLQAAEEAKRALTDAEETSVEIRLVQQGGGGAIGIGIGGGGGAGAGSGGGSEQQHSGGGGLGAAAGAASAAAAAARSELARVAASAPPVARVALSRQRFEQITRHLTERLWGPLREAAEEAGVELADDGLSDEERKERAASSLSAASSSSPASSSSSSSRYTPSPRRITRAILVGGGTRVPAVAALVERATGVRPEAGIDPEAAVALGAAALAGQLAGLGGSVELGDGAYAPDVHGRASGFD